MNRKAEFAVANFNSIWNQVAWSEVTKSNGRSWTQIISLTSFYIFVYPRSFDSTAFRPSIQASHKEKVRHGSLRFAVKKTLELPVLGETPVLLPGSSSSHHFLPIGGAFSCLKVLCLLDFPPYVERRIPKISTIHHAPIPRHNPRASNKHQTMKTKLLITLLLTAATPALLHAQGGSLIPPPGAPAPTMKSLDIIEARTPLVAGAPGVNVDGTTGAITITANGSYYLTGNLTTTGTASCINAGTHTCTIDLNGFIVSRTTGTETGSAGILIAGAAGQKVMIKNGFIRGGGTATGFAAAIDITDLLNGSVHVENVHVSNVRDGIILNYEEGRNSVRNSSVEISGGLGIQAEIVSGCMVRDTLSHGIFGNVVDNCNVTINLNTTTGIGIVDGTNVRRKGAVSNCVVIFTTGTGGRTGIRAKLVSSCLVDITAAAGSTPINADTAIGCVTTGGTNNISSKYNMP